jgi:hypothetical protein
MLLQEPDSEDCAIFAVANLLRLYGSSVSREDIARLFGHTSINHKRVLDTVARQIGQRLLRWTRLRTFSFDRLSGILDSSFSRNAPSVLTFHIRHHTKNWYGIHCVVALSSDDAGIHIIDSLGRSRGDRSNATIIRRKRARGWPVVGTTAIILPEPVFIMENLPALPKLPVLR